MGLPLPKQLPQLSSWVLTLYRYNLPILFMVGLFSVFYASPAATNRNTQFHTRPLSERLLASGQIEKQPYKAGVRTVRSWHHQSLSRLR